MTETEIDLIFDIRNQVMKTYNVKTEDLIKKKRRDVSDANCMTYLLVKKHFEKNKSKITNQALADILGMNTHSTIVNGIVKIKDLLKYDARTKHLFNKAQIRIINNVK
jgi:chromosomal replication initiation ATPase DnaA